MNPHKRSRNGAFSPAFFFSAGLTLLICGLVWAHWLPLGIPGEWVWEYKPREDWGLLRYAVLGALLLLLGAHLLWKHGMKEAKAARAATVLALLALCLLVRYCTWKATPLIGVRMTQVTLSPVATTYYSQALDISDMPSFLREYPRLMAAMPYHARTHPPGPTIFMRWMYQLVEGATRDPDRSLAAKALLEFPPSAVAEVWNEGPGRDYTPLEVLGAFWVGLAIALLGALAVLPVYFAAAQLFGRQAGLVAALLMAVVPSGLLFPVSIDQLVLLDAAVAISLLAFGITKKHFLPLLGSGLILGVGMLLSFGMMILLPAFAVLILWGEWSKERWRRLPAKAAGFLAAAALPALLLWAVYGCDMFTVYVKAVEAQRHELTEVVGRSYGKWIFGNLGDFFLLCGLPVSVYFSTFWGRRIGYQRDLHLGRKLGWIFLSVLLLLSLSGLVRGEAGRIWLFLMIFPTILAAQSLCGHGRSRAWQGFAVLGLQYLQVITLQSNATFLRPF